MAEINIQFLGVGNAFSKSYGNTSALISVENNDTIRNILIDCGRTTPNDLYAAGYTWNNIDAIFISHLHGDHVYGLEEAGFMGRYVFNKKPHIIIPHQKLKTDLWDRVLKGTMMNGDLERNMQFEDYFTYEIVDKDDQYFLFNDVMFSVYTTQHVANKKSYGLIIGEENFIIYTADTLMNSDFLEIAASHGCQAIFHDCGFADYKGKVHASLSELVALPESVREKVYIMHYGDNISDYYYQIKDNNLSIALRYNDYIFTVDEYVGVGK